MEPRSYLDEVVHFENLDFRWNFQNLNGTFWISGRFFLSAHTTSQESMKPTHRMFTHKSKGIKEMNFQKSGLWIECEW
jgi:hypothetical protein